jgi:hypothetical protein
MICNVKISLLFCFIFYLVDHDRPRGQNEHLGVPQSVFSTVYGRIIRARIKIINIYSYRIDFINTYDLQYDLIRYVRRNTARILVYRSPDHTYPNKEEIYVKTTSHMIVL